MALAVQAAPGRFALLLGSGVSIASGIPTGWDVVVDLCRRVAAASGVSPPPDDPVAWYEGQFTGTPDYSQLLATVSPTPAQRRDLLASYFEPTEEERVDGAKAPTAAHQAIAGLIARGLVRVVVTTNFDRLLEQALQAEGIEPIVVASEAAAAGTVPLVHSRCTVIKVHGDYLDPDIKNTVSELSGYGPSLDGLLDRVVEDYGLIICGWSATWDTALRAALERSPSRRYATYWAAHGDLSDEAARLVAHRDAFVAQIEGADEFFGRLLGRVEALNDLAASKARGVEIVVAEAKRYLADPVHRIRLHDLVLDAAGTAVRAVDFDGNGPSFEGEKLGDAEAYVRTMSRLEAASADIAAASAVLAAFAKEPDQIDLLRRSMLALTAPSLERFGGYVAWIELRGYPALLGLYAAGIAAVANENWTAMTRVISTRVRDPNRDSGDTALVAHVSTWHVLDHGMVNTLYPPNGHKTPISDHLFSRLEEWISPPLRVESRRFEEVFDRWEYLLGVVLHAEIGRSPIGRYAWKPRYAFGGSPPRDAVDAASAEMLGAGLFSGDAAVLEEAVAELDAGVERSGIRF
jgi:hypothetical protein